MKARCIRAQSLSFQIPPDLHDKPFQKPTRLKHREHTADSRACEDPDERYDDPGCEEAAREDVVGEEHGDGDLRNKYRLAGCLAKAQTTCTQSRPLDHMLVVRDSTFGGSAVVGGTAAAASASTELVAGSEEAATTLHVADAERRQSEV